MSRAGDEKRRENAVVEKAEKTWTEKSKKWLTNGGGGCIIFLVSSASVLRAKPNSGDLHSGSAVDSDSTCGSSILSSPTRPQPIGLRYFRGIAQLVARLVRDEEAVGSNPAAPTEKDRYTFVCRSFSISAAEATAASGRNRELRLGQRSVFSKPRQGAAEKAASATRRRRSRASNQPSGLLLSPRVPIFRNVNSW